ncbi:hypothetical protein [Paenibacillus popilliae]|nr:hypothetical protein [Paenibacillus sp. SDF0028]
MKKSKNRQSCEDCLAALFGVSGWSTMSQSLIIHNLFYMCDIFYCLLANP